MSLADSESLELKVTPEMYAVGAETFHNWRDLEFGDAETAAFCIFKAMILASPAFRNCRLVGR